MSRNTFTMNLRKRTAAKELTTSSTSSPMAARTLDLNYGSSSNRAKPTLNSNDYFPFQKLPLFLQLMVLKQLDFRSLLAFGSTCQELRELSFDCTLWTNWEFKSLFDLSGHKKRYLEAFLRKIPDNSIKCFHGSPKAILRHWPLTKWTQLLKSREFPHQNWSLKAILRHWWSWKIPIKIWISFCSVPLSYNGRASSLQ